MPTYAQRIVTALTTLRHRTGSTSRAIVKAICFASPSLEPAAVKRYTKARLKKMLAFG